MAEPLPDEPLPDEQRPAEQRPADPVAAEERARKRRKARRDFHLHLGTYLIINVMFAAIWALAGSGGFWPVWIILFWGVAVAFHRLYAYVGLGDA